MLRKALPIAAVCAALLSAGCSHSTTPPPTPPMTGGPGSLRPEVASAVGEFKDQTHYDPWILTSKLPSPEVPVFIGDGKTGVTIGPDGAESELVAGRYSGGALSVSHPASVAKPAGPVTLDLQTGTLSGVPMPAVSPVDWASLWKSTDIQIVGDPQAQQVTHANMFYLLSSTEKNGQDSVPPMGLSSGIYDGHIFWDAEIWMFPALVVQHPDYARSIINYRFRMLPQAIANAKAHGFAGAEYPWESADTGKEEAPGEFAAERHITADVAWAAWQYYLWTGDRQYLETEGWPILQATAEYWMSRIKMGADGKYHILHVLSPDETAGLVDDDAWTNGIVAYNLNAASFAATAAGQEADPKWLQAANNIYLPPNKAFGCFAEHAGPSPANYQAKQADAQMLVYPLNVNMTAAEAGATLDYWTAHTITVGPAMTSSINATVAARLGRGQQSLDLFRDSYQPFERTGLCAFSEKRTTNRVYFCTGMGGCLQSVIYGFCGLNVAGPGEGGIGRTLASTGDTILCCKPHLPPGWTSVTLKGVAFRGKHYDILVQPGDTVTCTYSK